MKERLKRKQLSTFGGILAIVALLACIFLIWMIISVLSIGFGALWLQYVEYVLFIIIGVLIIRYWVTEYEYSVIDGKLLADRYLGKRQKQLFFVKIKDIAHIGMSLPDDYKGKQQRLTYKSKRNGVVYIVYRDGSGKKCAYFSPSGEMLALIAERRAKKA